MLTPMALIAGCAVAAPDTEDDIRWLVQWDGTTAPQQQGWTPVGGLAAGARIVDAALRIKDDSPEEEGCFRARWTPDPSCETIVEGRVRVKSVTAFRGGSLMWPSVEGAPVGILVSDGKHQEGLVLHTDRAATFVDRVAVMDTRREFHTYRLVIRGNDMSIFVDGERKIVGDGAFWKPTATPEAFVQFGSNSKPWMGEADWSYVRLGVRKLHAAVEPPKLKITISEPWDIKLPEGVGCTRPYLYDMGRKLLLMSVAQGPDKWYEPYGVLKSTDEGKTWAPVKDLQLKTFAPLPMIRQPDGGILGVSRWSVCYDGSIHVGFGYRFDPHANRFAMHENRILLPGEMGADNRMVLERQILDVGGGKLLASARCYQRGPSGSTSRTSLLMMTADGGQTWTRFGTIGPGGETAVARLSDREMTALLRTGRRSFEQRWSHDGGKTWTDPVTLEEGSVDPDLVYMSNGVLACSYGRPGSNLMFSTDGGKTWRDHRVITDEKGYNYTAIREVRPGRLLYVHDAPHIRAVYVDVERLRPFDDSRLQQGLLFDQEGRRKRPGSKDYAELH